MKIAVDESGGVTILRLNGKLMGGPDSDEVQKVIKDAVGRGRTHVLVDMGKVSWVNSSGLGILISSHRTVQNAGGTLKLVGVNKRIDQILIVTKLHTIFETYDEETAALSSF